MPVLWRSTGFLSFIDALRRRSGHARDRRDPGLLLLR